MQSLDAFARAKLDTLSQQNLRRTLKETTRDAAATVTRNGRRLISFSCNDYLNLSHHPLVRSAAIEAVQRHGTGAGASRLISGNHPLFAQLEARLAKLKGTDDCLIFGSGYLANLGIIPALVDHGDMVLTDELSHACMLSGSRLSGATEIRFRHNDLEDVHACLTNHRDRFRRCLILTETVFGMDGDLAPLEELVALARQHDAWLMTDDAHGLGLSFGVNQSPLQMGTLSKSLGSYGGYLCASAPVIDLLRSRARTLVYSTGLPPSCVAAALAALEIIEADPDWAASPVAKARLFAQAMELPMPDSWIVPLIVGEADTALALSASLEAAGYLVAAIRPPTVPPGTARLRFSFTAGHLDRDIVALAAATCALLPRRAA